jgi:hypothetical protein
MEEEERAAQSAKLQELIRRGGPEDLQEANRLMKVMAGYDTRHKTDYRAKAAEEVSKVQQKAKLLEEMLQDYQTGDKTSEGDVLEVFDTTGRIVRAGVLTLSRNSQMPSKARTQRYKKCVRRNLMTLRPFRSSLRSMIAYIGPSNGTNW